jgi:hypothetical protein
MDPCYSDLEATTVYRHGMELHGLRHGKTNLSHYNAHLDRSNRASIEFGYAFGREPNQGDILSFQHVQVTRGPAALKVVFGQLIEAWRRQIPDLMCPYKFEGDRLFRHLRRGACRPCNGGAAIEGGWHEAIDEGPEWNWREIEKEMNGYSWQPPKLADIPTIPAIEFLGLVDGKHAFRLAFSQDLTWSWRKSSWHAVSNSHQCHHHAGRRASQCHRSILSPASMLKSLSRAENP